MKIKLPPCPEAGRGVHRWLFICCLRLDAHEIDPERWEAILEPLATRSLGPGEVQKCAETLSRGAYVTSPRWPGINEPLLAKVMAGTGSMSTLAAFNPGGGGMHDNPREILAQLYPNEALLCCGASNRTFTTRSLTEWEPELLKKLQFIVPNPMIARQGKTQSGWLSAHCLEATGPKVYQVVEFDQGALDDHAKILLYLKQFAPLVMVVHSGGKSLHGWFDVANNPEKLRELFFERAVSLGADRATWTRSQFVRMPGGLRDNGNIQRVIYFDRCV
jgi:hypothetical protein